MSNDFQKRLYDQEVTPPAAAWENIAAALDESHLTDKFPSVLYNAEDAVPVAWATIANALDEKVSSKTFPENIHDLEVDAPAAAWSSIAVALDDSHLADKFPSTLYNAQATPPATAWEKIKAAIETEEAKVAPVKRMFPKMARYAAAAAIFAAVAFGAVKLVNNNNNDGGLANNPTNPTIEKTNSPVNNEVVTNGTTGSTETSQEARDAAALEDSKRLYASLDASDMQRIKRVSEAHFLSAANPINTSSSINPGNTYRDLECSEVSGPSFNDDASPIDMANRYSMLMTPDGHIVRISKKLGPMVCCVSGEDTDEDCNNQLKKWKERMASSSTGTSGNFLDILSLIESFKE